MVTYHERLRELWSHDPPDMAAIEAVQNEYLAERDARSSSRAWAPAHEPTPAIATTCIHLGKPKAAVKVSCTGCGGKPASIFHWSFECSIHDRCLPHFRGPWGEAQQDLEAKTYTLCHQCDDREVSDEFAE